MGDFGRSRNAGADVAFVSLPSKGILGNTHMMMMDRNSHQVAALIQDWLVEKKLASR